MSALQLLDHGPVPLAVVQHLVPSYTPGCFVRSYDPTVGLPSLMCTTDRELAVELGFNEAVQLWRSVLTSDPVRPDGQPNRPLTAFTIEVMR